MPGQDLVEIFHDGHFRTQTQPNATQFQTNYAAANDDHMIGHFRQFECTGAVDDDMFAIVDIDVRQRGDRRPGCDDNVFRGDRLVADLDAICAFKRAAPL